jgi:predicted permease
MREVGYLACMFQKYKKSMQSFLAEFLQDVRFGSRLIVRDPLFTACIVLSLALGIGLSGAAFSYYNALFLRPVPGVNGTDRILVLYTSLKGAAYLPVSYPNFEDLRQMSDSFSRVAAAHVVHVALAKGGIAEPVTGELVTANYFETLGLKARLGRFFQSQEDLDPVVVLSEGLWRRRFGADPQILGRSVLLNHRPYSIVGVIRGGFHGANMFAPADLWLPIGMYPETSTTAALFPRRGDQTVQVLGRIRLGVSVRKAEFEVKGLSARLVSAFPAENHDQTIVSIPLTEAWVHPFGRPILLRNSLLLLVITGILLLVTCSNVANMLLLRALKRTSEFAIRNALGAGRRRLARQLLAEGLLLIALSLSVSVFVAYLGAQFLWKFRPAMLSTAAAIEPLDGRVLGFLFMTGGVSLILFCLAPVLYAGRLPPATALRKGRKFVASSRFFSSERWLVVIEVALCLVAVSCATFFLIRLRELQRVDPGFAKSRLLALSFDLRSLGLAPSSARLLEENLRERISSLPGVESVAFAENRLLGGFQLLRQITIAGREGDPVLVGSGLVEPGFFLTVGIPLLQGRSFSPADRSGSAPVAILNKTLAARLWPSQSPLGAHIYVDDEKTPVEIVGVVANTKLSRLDEPPRPFLYLSFQQRDCLKMSLHVRMAGQPADLQQAAAREVRALATDLPVEVKTVDDLVKETLSWTRATASLLAFLSLLALLVAGIGIYGATAYAMRRRSFEIGLRIALGAGRSSILGLVLRDGAQVTLIGTVLGAGAALALTRWSAGLLQMPPPTLLSLAACSVLLLTVSSLATLLPAVRVVNSDPSAVLKGSE